MSTRLSTISPELDETIRKASSEQKYELASAFSEWALRNSLYQGPMPASQSEARVLLERLDSKYWDLQESEGSSTSVAFAFSQARAMNAALFAFGGDASEAAYEAVIATDDLAGAHALAKVVLS